VFRGLATKEQHLGLVITYSREDLQQKNVCKCQIFEDAGRTIFNNLIIQPVGFDENIWTNGFSEPIVDYIKRDPKCRKIRLGILLVAE